MRKVIPCPINPTIIKTFHANNNVFHSPQNNIIRTEYATKIFVKRTKMAVKRTRTPVSGDYSRDAAMPPRGTFRNPASVSELWSSPCLL